MSKGAGIHQLLFNVLLLQIERKEVGKHIFSNRNVEQIVFGN
ncbi:hypothetical protein AB3U99_24255 [Niallia sp. JL1B1071]